MTTPEPELELDPPPPVRGFGMLPHDDVWVDGKLLDVIDLATVDF